MRRVLVIAAVGACAHDPAPQDCADTDAACTTTGPETTSETTGVGPSATAEDTIQPDSSSSASTTTAQPDTSSSTAAACREHSDCSADAPFCESGTCVGCERLGEPDPACAELDPDLPLCVDDACVQCSERDSTMCTGIVPICDVASHTCVGCTMHEQCPDSACHRADGSCFSPEVVLHVDGDATSCVFADGTEALPFCTMEDALAEIGPASLATLRVAATAAPYLEPIEITSDRIVAVVPWGEAEPAFDMQGAAPTVLVDGATAYLWRIRLEGNGSQPPLVLDDAIAYVERTTVVQNAGGGLVLGAGAELHLWNSVVGAGGTGLAAHAAIEADDSTFDVVHSTIAGNDSTGASSLVCSGTASGTIRNSIVVGLDPPSIQCAAVEIATSAIDTAGIGGADVTVIDAFNLGWFVDAAAGDFHLVPDTLFETLGIHEVGDPIVDLDGDPRPTREGAVDVAGADVP